MDSHSKSSSKAAAVAAIAPPTVAVLYSMTTAASTSADTGMGPATYLFSVTLNSLVTKVQQQQYLPVLAIIPAYYPYSSISHTPYDHRGRTYVFYNCTRSTQPRIRIYARHFHQDYSKRI